ncbi:MAG: hypothetical protein LUH47_07915 [Clostridiales bacterium]|nr:hypothetical protein [Clostridiales bacterium]
MCCLFGLIDYDNCLSVGQKRKIIKVLSKAAEDRGTDATGISYNYNGKAVIYKRPLPAHKMNFRFKGNPKVIMGHTHLTTQGSETINANNHPFLSEKLGFTLAHNGSLYNDTELRYKEDLPKTNIQTDSYVAVQLIEKKNTLSFDSLKYMAEKVEGSFCFTVLDKNDSLYIVKGDNPMTIAEFNGYYIYASTVEILRKTLIILKLTNTGIVRISDGDILKISSDGSISNSTFKMDSFYSSWSNWTRTSRMAYWNEMVYTPTKAYSTKKKNENSYLNDLINYGKYVGIDEDVILELLDLGYDYGDIENMFYDPDYLQDVIDCDLCSEI